MINHRQCRYPYRVVPENWEPYDDRKDYCGPEGSWISRFIPRDIWGIDCNRVWYAHDQRYRLGTTKEDKIFADKQMYRDAVEVVKRTATWWRPLRYRAWFSAVRRYHMVKWFGQKAFENKGAS